MTDGRIRSGAMARRTKVLFLCVGNACRSQMAESIAKKVAADVIEPSSAGLVAFGEIPALTVTVLEERGYSSAGQTSKSLRTEAVSAADLIINMSGHSSASLFDEPNSAAPMPTIEDWDVGDPYGFNLTVYRSIRDQIELRVEQLAQRLREVNVGQAP